MGFDIIKCKKIWDHYDADKSGTMDLDELNNVIKAMRKATGDKNLPYLTPEVSMLGCASFCGSERVDCLPSATQSAVGVLLCVCARARVPRCSNLPR